MNVFYGMTIRQQLRCDTIWEKFDMKKYDFDKVIEGVFCI
jgi:hypothetical protein